MTYAPVFLALATAVVFAAPAASAQSGDGSQRRDADPAMQATQTDAVVRESLLTTNAPVGEQLDTAAPPAVGVEEEEEAMRRDRRRAFKIRPKPPRAASAADARGAAWHRLDIDGDGRISRIEGEADAGFTSNFETMDADRDGFITDREYRPERGDDPTRGGEDAVDRDPQPGDRRRDER